MGWGDENVNAAVVKLASFKAEPREGHLDRARRVVSCLNLSILLQDFEQKNLICLLKDQCVVKLLNLPEDAPEPKGNHVATVSYHDASASQLCDRKFI